MWWSNIWWSKSRLVCEYGIGIDDIICEYLHLASIAGMDDITCEDLPYDYLNLDECENTVLGFMI